MTDAETTPADHLEGVVLESGWVIGPKVLKKIGASGANFGICYTATRGNETAFCKAVDFRKAFSESDFLAAVSELANHAIWEKEVMEYCGEHGLSKIIRLLDHQYVLLPAAQGDVTKRISCLLMEVGDGDLRNELNLKLSPSTSWKLYVMRDVALAIDQLHRKGIAHLDVKPSNVIAVGNGSSARASMKLGDLGRVVRKGLAGPFDAQIWPGDPNYRPPEKWYGLRSAQWNDEREAADAFLLGSLLVFLLTGIPMSTLLYHEIPEPYRPGIYRGDFDDALMDVLVRAQSQVIATYVTSTLPTQFADELLLIITELTDPNPRRRGDKRARAQGIVGIDRYHQRFLRMAMRLEHMEKLATK